MRPETIRACPDPPRRRRHLKISHNGSRGLALVPVVTAAAVALIIGGASVAASQLLTGNHHGGPNTRHGQSTVGALHRGLPRYFITSDGDTSPLIVRDTSTGAITGRLAPPRGMFFPAVAAAADGRTFLVVAEPISGSCHASLYRIRLDSRGRPGPLSRLGITVQGTFNGSNLALTPDGRLAAYATYHCGRGNGEIGVINLRTHQVRKWTSEGGPLGPADLSLTADGRVLSFVELLSARTGQKPILWVSGLATVELATDAQPGAALTRSLVVLRSVAAGAISSDGTKLYACMESPTNPSAATGVAGAPALFTITLRVYDASAGRLLGVLHRWPHQRAGSCHLIRNASGSYLLMRLPENLVWWNIAEGKPGPLLPATSLPYGVPKDAIAW